MMGMKITMMNNNLDTSSTLGISCFNAHSLWNKEAELLSLVMSHELVFVCETWSIWDSNSNWKELKEIRFAGVKGVGFCYPSGRRGIACFHQRKLKIAFSTKYSFQDDDLAVIVGFIGDLCLVFAYIPIGSDDAGITKLVDLLELLSPLYSKIVVGGDLNACLEETTLRPKNRCARELLSWLNLSDFARVPINSPTFVSHHGATVLDHFLVRGIQTLDYGVYSGSTSDHHPIFISVPMVSRDAFRWKQKVKWDKVVALMESRVATFDEFGDMDLQVNRFNALLGECIEESSSRVRFKAEKLPMWIDRDLRALVRKRNRHGFRRREWNALSSEMWRRIRKGNRESWRAFVRHGLQSKNGLWRFFRK